jgi:cell division protein FtsX
MPLMPAEQQSWYLMMGLAMVVSVAGVLNALLMSVTQRYREIGTMKCLGALDGFILLSVLLEAAILGVTGAVLGVLAGLASIRRESEADSASPAIAWPELEADRRPVVPGKDKPTAATHHPAVARIRPGGV